MAGLGRCSPNRTFEVLKFALRSANRAVCEPPNRTFEVLKFSRVRAAARIRIPPNRTFEVLKSHLVGQGKLRCRGS